METLFHQNVWVLKTLSARKYEYWKPFSARNYEYSNLFPPEILNIGTFYLQKLWILEPFTSRNYKYSNLLPPEIINIGTILTKEITNIGHQLFGVKNEYWGTQFYWAIEKLRPVNIKKSIITGLKIRVRTFPVFLMGPLFFLVSLFCCIKKKLQINVLHTL